MSPIAQVEVKVEESAVVEVAEISLDTLDLIAGGAATVNCL